MIHQIIFELIISFKLIILKDSVFFVFFLGLYFLKKIYIFKKKFKLRYGGKKKLNKQHRRNVLHAIRSHQ